jgi:hypothetical protein
VLTAKTTEEFVISKDSELKTAVDRQETNNIRKKSVRVKAAQARASACLKEITTARADAPGDLKPALKKLKQERYMKNQSDKKQ